MDLWDRFSRWQDFNLPKLHSLVHYVESIELFGTTDNYNTKYTERLHIDLAKDAYRATNHRDEHAQMIIWLERKEKIFRHQSYLEWRLGNKARVTMRPPSMAYNRVLTLTKWLSRKAVDLGEIVTGQKYILYSLNPTNQDHKCPSFSSLSTVLKPAPIID